LFSLFYVFTTAKGEGEGVFDTQLEATHEEQSGQPAGTIFIVVVFIFLFRPVDQDVFVRDLNRQLGTPSH